MIQVEDNSPLINGFDLIIPINYTKNNDEEVVIHTYEETLELAKQFEDKFSGQYFSNSALCWLNERVNDFFSYSDYRTDDGERYRWLYDFRLTEKLDLNLAVINSRTEIISSLEGLENLTSYDLEDYFSSGSVAAAAIIDGKLISAAVVNSGFEDKDFVEISVETAIGYRGRGHGASCVSALSRELIKKYREIDFNCSRYNYMSQKIAKRVGYQQVGRSYFCVCYKKGQE